jgi:hypothetical protein
MPYTKQLQKLRAKFRSDLEIVLNDGDIEALDEDGFMDSETISAAVEVPTSGLSAKKPLVKEHVSEL